MQPKAKEESAEHLLQTASAGAANLEGADRAYAYWLIARAFSQISPQEEKSALKKSCEATISSGTGDEDAILRERIQLDCLRRMIAVQPKTAKEFLAQASSLAFVVGGRFFDLIPGGRVKYHSRHW